VAYYVDLFTLETWHEFQAAGARVSGFRESRWGHMKRMQPGDRLLCYLVGAKRWIAVLRVTGKPYMAHEPVIWKVDDFPCRVAVEVELQLTPETAMPVVETLADLSIMDKIKEGKSASWGVYFQGSPSRWSEEDGAVVVAAIQQALADPVARPVPRQALRRTKPRPVDSGTSLGLVTLPEEELAEPDAAMQELPDAAQESEHTEVQALLVRLGRAMGHRVFVARGDHNRTWQGKALGDMPGITEKLPTTFNDATNRVVEHIDVLWLDDNAIAAAFEVERTTSIYSGLLRMSDLLVMQPNLDIPIFLVAPEARRDKVLREVNRPTFKALRP